MITILILDNPETSDILVKSINAKFHNRQFRFHLFENLTQTKKFITDHKYKIDIFICL